MKILINRFIFIFIISILAYVVFPHALDSNVLSTIYNISCILFSVGMGLIITFNLNDIKNTSYIYSIRNRINLIRDKYIQFFTIMTVLYLSNYIIPNYSFSINFPYKLNALDIDINNFMRYITLTFCLFTIFYFTINFKGVQKLKDEICDRLHSQ